MVPSLTLFFIVEPPRYQYLACYLAASIRTYLDPKINLIGYCPEHRMEELSAEAIETLRRMRCPVVPFAVEGQFDPPYPHGNKILACLQPRETEFSGFIDSDVLFIKQQDITRLCVPGTVTCSPAASILWAPENLWTLVYGAFDMPVPEERITLMRRTREMVVPYFSSGFVIFPEAHRMPKGLSFPDTWMESARIVDEVTELEPFCRPYLDQMTLPVAMRRAGLGWNELAEDDHYILGGRIRGKPLPEGRDITCVHYRKWEVLDEVGLSKAGYDALRQQVGTRRVSRINEFPLPDGIDPAPMA